jgi:hypothetical protein
MAKDFPKRFVTCSRVDGGTWFGPLRQFRTELTHGSTGTCHLDPTTQRIAYFNEGIKKGDGCFHLEDIENYLRETDEHVRTLVENICAFHFRQLEAKPQFKMCGMYRRRWYGRMVAPTNDLSFRDGHCLSYDWFEREEGYFCPLADECPGLPAKMARWISGSVRRNLIAPIAIYSPFA